MEKTINNTSVEKQIIKPKQKNKRNSLIELYRFIFSMNVVKNHGYFPYQGPYFSPGAYSVEFFFVLSGFLLLRSIDKYRNLPIIKGIASFIWKKFYSLGFPLVIGLVFNIIYKVSIGDLSSGIWMYLWYVQKMILVFTVYFILRKLIKNEKVFVSIVAVVALSANIIHFTNMFYSWGLFRAIGSISVGILLSYIPSISEKYKKYIWIFLAPTMILVLYILLFNCPTWVEIFLNNLLYPSLIYFSFQLNIHCKIFNYLGSLSFGLYAFQSIARCALLWGVNNLWVLFITILAPTVLEDATKRIVRKYKTRNYTLKEGQRI